MAHRLCETCKRAENPLNRLKFKKNLDGKVYCENCQPVNVEVLDPAPPAARSSPLPGTSAGSLVVIPCPDCYGEGRTTRNPTHSALSKCKSCAGYGQVRVPANFLNVYKPTSNKPETLTEG